jgi:uncharacterized membrane protein YgcG
MISFKAILILPVIVILLGALPTMSTQIVFARNHDSGSSGSNDNGNSGSSGSNDNSGGSGSDSGSGSSDNSGSQCPSGYSLSSD